MSQSAVIRFVEAFFYRWPFYTAIFLGSMLLGVMNVADTPEEYTSVGSVFVDSQSLVSVQSGVQNGGFSFYSPSQFTAQELNGLIRTEVFIEAAARRGGVDLSENPVVRVQQLAGLQQSVNSWVTSVNLVAVAATTDEPELSHRLANAVIDEFIQFQINVDIAESGASEVFFTELLESFQDELLAAQAAVDSALRGADSVDDLPPDRQLEVQRLQAVEFQANERYDDALANVEASRLSALQTETDIRQTYSVFSPPSIPLEPNGGLLSRLTVLGFFALIGLILALAGPLAASLLSRNVVFVSDMELDDGLVVFALLPKVRKKSLRLDKLSPALSGEATGDEDLGRQTITFRLDGAPAETAAQEVVARADQSAADLVDGIEHTSQAPTAAFSPADTSPGGSSGHANGIQSPNEVDHEITPAPVVPSRGTNGGATAAVSGFTVVDSESSQIGATEHVDDADDLDDGIVDLGDLSSQLFDSSGYEANEDGGGHHA